MAIITIMITAITLSIKKQNHECLQGSNRVLLLSIPGSLTPNSVPDIQHALIKCLLNEVHLKLINLLERQFLLLAKSQKHLAEVRTGKHQTPSSKDAPNK